jgi:hypothetical protein
MVRRSPSPQQRAGQALQTRGRNRQSLGFKPSPPPPFFFNGPCRAADGAHQCTHDAYRITQAHLVFNQQNPLSLATGDPRPSQIVRSTPLGMSCSELQEHNAPRAGLRRSLRLRFCPQSGYVPVPTRGSQLSGFPVPSRYTLPGGACTKLVWKLGPNLAW